MFENSLDRRITTVIPVSGRVLLSGSEDHSGVEVLLKNTVTHDSVRVISAENGVYSIALAPGTYSISFSRPPYFPPVDICFADLFHSFSDTGNCDEQEDRPSSVYCPR